MPSEGERRRLRLIVGHNALATPEDLDRFLATDPQTAGNAPMQLRWRRLLEDVAPALKHPGEA